jgi:hypothetical protein
MSSSTSVAHSADGAALGFYYQSLYALYEILRQPHDDAAVCLERLDDVEIFANGQPLLIQLKHSIVVKPDSVTLSSRALWRTIKVWIDVLPKVDLAETRFQLVTVASLDKKSVLSILLDESADRNLLHDQLVQEAERVVSEYQKASALKKSPLPHSDRIAGCNAFLQLDKIKRKTLLTRMTICPGTSNISALSNDIASRLVNFPPTQRSEVCTRLIEWWDLQVIFSLCGKRERFISKIEAQEKISEIAGEIERDELLPDFETSLLPDNHIPNSMIIQQINLVSGTPTDIKIAVREEWRARAQRHKWCTERLDMATRIEVYDLLLLEAWQDKFERMSEDCDGLDDSLKCKYGRDLLRWSFDIAHKEVRPFADSCNTTYYVRGSYQVLSVDLKVGWHPQFQQLLKQNL